MATQIALDHHRIAEFCEKWGIAEFSLFGSVLREDFRPDSDVDVLVRFAPGTIWGLLDIGRMEGELKSILGREVDLVRREAIERSKNYIRRKHILSSVETVYVAGRLSRRTSPS